MREWSIGKMDKKTGAGGDRCTVHGERSVLDTG
jgi:hypothetical protein